MSDPLQTADHTNNNAVLLESRLLLLEVVRFFVSQNHAPLDFAAQNEQYQIQTLV